MAEQPVKPLLWVASSLNDLRQFPEEIQDEVGYALYLAQCGDRHMSAKPLKGLARGASVMEVVARDTTGAYRAVYTVEFQGVIYVLHAFQKKSKRGIATPKEEIELVKARLRLAAQDFRQRRTENEEDAAD